MTSSTDSKSDTPLQTALSEITEIDKRVAVLSDQIDELKKRRDHLESIAVEELTTQRLDGVRAAGRSWRVEWTHSCSVPEARKQAVMEAAESAGLKDAVTQVNTARLKSLLKEMATEAGTDARTPWSQGTVFEGLVGEYVQPKLRHLTVG
jgi:predicted AAA+ superfamily ATPase